MEVLVEAAPGLPPDAVLSLRLGGTRRQAPLQSALSHPLRFSTPLEGACEPLRVDVLRPVSTAHVVLRAEETRYAVAVHGHDAAVHISVKPSIAKTAHRGCGPHDEQRLSTSLPGFKDAAASAKEYLEKHGLLQYMQSMLHAVIQAKPSDPFAYMVEQLTAAQISEPARLAEEVPEVFSDPGRLDPVLGTPRTGAASDPGVLSALSNDNHPVETRAPSPCAEIKPADAAPLDVSKEARVPSHPLTPAPATCSAATPCSPSQEGGGLAGGGPPTARVPPQDLDRAADPQRLDQVRTSLQRHLRHAIAAGKLETSVQQALDLVMNPTRAEERLRKELCTLHGEREKLLARSQRLRDDLDQLRHVNQQLRAKLSECG